MNQEPEILVISHNSSAVIFKLLDELYGKFNISVVDNASHDSTVERIKHFYPKIKLLALNKNVGYGNAANLILENTKNKYVLLLNPDIEIKADEILEFLKISKSLDFTVTGLPEDISSIKRQKTEKLYIATDWVMGCVMLFNMEKMQGIGFFDKNIFLYGEENELCYRIIKSGKKIYCINNIEFKHHLERSAPLNDDYIFLRQFHRTYSGFYLKSKKYGRIKAARLAIGGVFKGTIQGALSKFLNKNPAEQKARVLASIYYLLGKAPFDKDGNGLFAVNDYASDCRLTSRIWKSNTLGMGRCSLVVHKILAGDMNKMKWNPYKSIAAKYKRRCKKPSDINEHLPTLARYASYCKHVTECGVRSAMSSYALAKGLVGREGTKLIQVDPSLHSNIIKFQGACADEGLQSVFYEQSDLECPIEETDLLFIDTWHIYGQLRRELARWHSYVRKYIILHDTTSDEWHGETVREGYDAERQSLETGIPVDEICKGLWPAVQEFLQEHPEWIILERYTKNNGLTVLVRHESAS
jgi:N-acetylglucosaminyl-diphospho-decaprenol L-rhamnosyltransferase